MKIYEITIEETNEKNVVTSHIHYWSADSLQAATKYAVSYVSSFTDFELMGVRWVLNVTQTCPPLEGHEKILEEITTWQLFQTNLGIWSDKTFGNRTPDGSLHHLAAEVQEVLEAPDDITEYADCVILLLDAARIAGFSADDLFTAMIKKFEINKARKWGKPNAHGFTEHVKDK